MKLAAKAILITGTINADGRVWWSDGTWTDLKTLRLFDTSEVPHAIPGVVVK